MTDSNLNGAEFYITERIIMQEQNFSDTWQFTPHTWHYSFALWQEYF